MGSSAPTEHHTTDHAQPLFAGTRTQKSSPATNATKHQNQYQNSTHVTTAQLVTTLLLVPVNYETHSTSTVITNAKTTIQSNTGAQRTKYGLVPLLDANTSVTTLEPHSSKESAFAQLALNSTMLVSV